MRRKHLMPFGAHVDGAQTRFRLWAPAAARVDLVATIDGREHDRQMPRNPGGWFEATLPAPPGSRYAYRIDGGLVVPDPASRCNPDDVHGRSEVVDPDAYEWKDAQWQGRPWEEAVVYELHVGTFTPEGTFEAAVRRFDELVEVGVTALELMPIADFPGSRNWGYDGVLLFAPDSTYGRPDDLKRLVDAAHARGLMVLLDVVYNHFGPDGNYLHAYAPQFFNARHQTPWGAAINFDGEQSDVVRRYFVHNALYWLEEFHFDGLRLDAVHAIADDSRPDIVDELATTVRAHFGERRRVHLVLENDRNQASRLARVDGRPRLATAQWNDDFHHALHVVVTGEDDGYYSDYADRPVERFARALAEGFVYQGEPSSFRGGESRGERSDHLAPTAFVDFAQNHDQVGNRALGERLTTFADPRALRAAAACMLLAPSVPLLFMGEEFGATTPFLFFCAFEGELAEAVTQGRRNEFTGFARFRDPAARERIPDPVAASTFLASKLDWRQRDANAGREWLDLYRSCLAVRRERIVPLIPSIERGGSHAELGERAFIVSWPLRGGGQLMLLANFADSSVPLPARPSATLLFATDVATLDGIGELPSRAAMVWLER
jgi:maltooligosyltrehalose trehalohydrolase